MLVIFFLSKKIFPAVVCIKPKIACPVVDLPQPLSPTNPSVFPFLILKLILSTAVNTVFFLKILSFLILKFHT